MSIIVHSPWYEPSFNNLNDKSIRRFRYEIVKKTTVSEFSHLERRCVATGAQIRPGLVFGQLLAVLPSRQLPVEKLSDLEVDHSRRDRPVKEAKLLLGHFQRHSVIPGNVVRKLDRRRHVFGRHRNFLKRARMNRVNIYCLPQRRQIIDYRCENGRFPGVRKLRDNFKPRFAF